MGSGDGVIDAITAHDATLNHTADCSDLEVCQNVTVDTDSGCPPDDHVTVVNSSPMLRIMQQIENYFPSVGNIPLVLRPRGIFPTLGK